MRILVAEDETIIRLDLKDLLERAGFEVVELGDLLARHADAGNELRIAPTLYPLWDDVIETTLDFSGIRLRNATLPA